MRWTCSEASLRRDSRLKAIGRCCSANNTWPFGTGAGSIGWWNCQIQHAYQPAHFSGPASLDLPSVFSRGDLWRGNEPRIPQMLRVVPHLREKESGEPTTASVKTLRPADARWSQTPSHHTSPPHQSARSHQPKAQGSPVARVQRSSSLSSRRLRESRVSKSGSESSALRCLARLQSVCTRRWVRWGSPSLRLSLRVTGARLCSPQSGVFTPTKTVPPVAPTLMGARAGTFRGIFFSLRSGIFFAEKGAGWLRPPVGT